MDPHLPLNSLQKAAEPAQPAEAAVPEVHSSRRGEGTGLGLHLSNKLAALIGGRIEFESVYGQGSCFTVLVPKI